VVAVAVCVVSVEFVLVLVGLANADPDASIKAIAVANVRLLIEISPVVRFVSNDRKIGLLKAELGLPRRMIRKLLRSK